MTPVRQTIFAVTTPVRDVPPTFEIRGRRGAWKVYRTDREYHYRGTWRPLRELVGIRMTLWGARRLTRKERSR